MRYYDALGKRREKSKQGLPLENAAIRALLEVKAAVFNGETRRVENDQLTVSEWVDIWFEAYRSDWKPATVRLREDTIRLHIKSLLGKNRLSALDRTAYKLHFLNVLSIRLSLGTVPLYH